MALARAVLAWERLWPAAWPATGIAGLFLVFALLDVFPALPGWLHLAIDGVFAAAFFWALLHGLAAFRSPGTHDARRRLERASALEHRPLTAIRDRIASGAEDARSAALWALHQRRMQDSIRALQVGLPSPGLARRDPAALRAALLVLLVIAAVIAWPEPLARIERALAPQFGGAATQTATLRLWIAPPEYTGKAPLYPVSAAAQPGAAAAETPALSIPAGSALTAQVSGGRGLPRLVLGKDEKPFERLDDGVYKAAAKIERGDRLAVLQGGKTLGEWRMEVVPDRPPTVEIDPAPEATERGALKLSYKAADDYGLAKVKATLRLKQADGSAAQGAPMEIDLPLPRLLAKSVAETTYHDLTTHPWAGLDALLRLSATDAADQNGESEILPITIPERHFNNPVAQAIIAERKKLSQPGPETRLDVISGLERIASRPGAFEDDIVVFLALITARSRLAYDPTDAVIAPIQKLLWDTALRVEDGKLSIAEREMRELEQKLMEALARNAPDAEIERLMRELQQALDRFLQSLAEELAKRPADQQQMMPFDPQTRMIEGRDLQRMLQRAQELMQMGARDAARDLLSQLRNILENLQMGRMMNMQRMMQNSQGGEAMRELQDMIRRQNELLNRSFRMSREGGQKGQMQSGAEQQRALREALQRLRQQLEQMGGDMGEAGEELERAEGAMGDAEGALGRGEAGEAIGPQTEALNRLQQAGRGLMQQMMSQMGYGPGYGTDLMGPYPQLRGRRDPLGRPLPEEGRGFDSGDVKIPDESDIQRAKRIVDELRRRAAQRSRENFELDYIDRLLKRF